MLISQDDEEVCILAFPCVSLWPKMPLFNCLRHNISQHLLPKILQIISSSCSSIPLTSSLGLLSLVKMQLVPNFYDSALPHLVTISPRPPFTVRMCCRDKSGRVVSGNTNDPAGCLESVAKQCGRFWFTITSSDRQLVAISVFVGEAERVNEWTVGVCVQYFSLFDWKRSSILAGSSHRLLPLYL